MSSFQSCSSSAADAALLSHCSPQGLQHCPERSPASQGDIGHQDKQLQLRSTPCHWATCCIILASHAAPDGLDWWPKLDARGAIIAALRPASRWLPCCLLGWLAACLAAAALLIIFSWESFRCVWYSLCRTQGTVLSGTTRHLLTLIELTFGSRTCKVVHPPAGVSCLMLKRGQQSQVS